jgi:predicted site-specific integrase-resolvase
MPAELPMSPLLTPAEAAEILRVDRRTLSRYAGTGRVQVVRLTPRTLRYTTASVRALIDGAPRKSVTPTTEVQK